jgi:heterodisulfide reductase subunit D
MTGADSCPDEQPDRSFASEVTPDVEALLSCIQCGSCTSSCPTASRMSVSPRRLSGLIRQGLKDEVLASKAFWLCAACDACTAHCPRGISLLDTMIGLKAYAIARGLEVPEDLELLRRTLKSVRNISGDPNSERLLWSRNLPQPLSGVAGKKGADVLFFVGCVSAFYPRAFSIPQALGRTLEHAGVSFTTLGAEEWCCGYPLANLGLAHEMEELVEHNIARVRALGASLMVTTCPSCHYTWTKIYPRFGSLPPNLTIMHAVQFLAELIDGKRIRPGSLSRAVTYHDPCDLGRKGGVFDAPRHVLGKIPGVELTEMANTGENALCCGGGGDVKIFSYETTMEVAKLRVRQAVDVDADTIVSACQQCKRALTGAAQLTRLPVRVIDLTEIVWESLHNQVVW